MEPGASADTQWLERAVGHLEGTLRDAVRGVHRDIGALRSDVEQRLEELLHLLKPLGQSVARLQQENSELRGQMQRLAGRLDPLTAAAGTQPGAAGSAAALESRPGGELAEQNGMEGGRQMAQVISLHSERGKEVPAPIPALQEHQPAAVGLAHLPISAVTKSGEKFSAEVSSGGVSRPESLSHLTLSKGQTAEQADKNTNVSKTVSSVSHSMSSDVHSPSSVLDLYSGVTSKSRSPPPTLPRQGGKRPLLMRSQTLPRISGPQSRKALFEKFEQESSRGKDRETKGKLQRSQSFASASSIKQILLEWCRSKTIGYKLIDIQNFSSSWSNGMAFCALIHSFFPESFDYNELNPSNRKQNFELAFGLAEKLAHCDRLIEVEDMMVMGNKPDPMCIFTYVQSLYNHLRRFE
ncbi:smoothelin, like isoform X1 [Narcine bancroftii]|uniref:smoothelin, like isoform X1 n=1 Tax=Narcine bancroftii TaxID=1343680 RepID=UPI0038317F34